MQTEVVFAYRRLCRSAEVLDIHLAGRDDDRANQAIEAMASDSDLFESLPANTARDITLKAKEAIGCLLAGGHESAAELLRTFFRTRKAIDATWLRDLRMRCEAVQHLAPDCDYSHRCLQSILAGVGRPRLA